MPVGVLQMRSLTPELVGTDLKMNSQITKKDNILEFGRHEINSSRGPLACRVFMKDGVATDLIIRFTDKEFSSDIEDYHPLMILPLSIQ